MMIESEICHTLEKKKFLFNHIAIKSVFNLNCFVHEILNHSSFILEYPLPKFRLMKSWC